ncbi:acyl carrier protein [Acetobacter malorum DSM 14337]|uniref:Acyl carrier protein n=1 Tax=Acetobacter malorum DSM 14337 TaxID=1307910 RepID=A0ABQ0PZS4_9PROT|nr:acyl carrier protein [Acetobacter malorum]KXV05798.1 acyl carrier protein [Acetobacter malorum]GBQ85621.1 acyl carrier protein [Acetobacter malorum DSM 14337]
MSETADKIRKIVGENLGFDTDKVKPESRFVEDLNADSLDIVEMVMAFEEAFNIEIPEDAAEKMTTVQNVIDYIETRRNS